MRACPGASKADKARMLLLPLLLLLGPSDTIAAGASTT
jgi:hypothetical protein